MALEMRPACEICSAATPADAAPCPNCGGELVARPRRNEDPSEAAEAPNR
jgi:hypothetical protein